MMCAYLYDCGTYEKIFLVLSSQFIVVGSLFFLFLKACVFRLLEKESPSLDTIKMQVYFDMNYTNRTDFLDEHKRVLESRLQSVTKRNNR